MRLKRPEILAIIIGSYMLLALLWWAILLYQKNEQLYQQKKQNYELIQKDQSESIKNAGLTQIDKEYSRQRWMIIGEGLFLATSLLIGIYIIMRAAKKQIEVQNQQNNFLLSITHELKTPIASIKLILQTLQKRTLAPAKTNELVHHAQSENTRLEKLVDNLLTSAKLEDGYPYHFEQIELNSFLSSLVAKFNLLDSKNVHWSTIDHQAFIEADPQALGLVFNNLISNGLRYSEKAVELMLKVEKGFYKIQVKDFGEGIEKAFQNRMFDKFTRSKDEETRTHKGTGLGLYLVKEILNGHHAKVVYSNESASIFTVTLKASQ